MWWGQDAFAGQVPSSPPPLPEEVRRLSFSRVDPAPVHNSFSAEDDHDRDDPAGAAAAATTTEGDISGASSAPDMPMVVEADVHPAKLSDGVPSLLSDKGSPSSDGEGVVRHCVAWTLSLCSQLP